MMKAVFSTLLLMLVVTVAGCKSGPSGSSKATAPSGAHAMHGGGFLGDYSQLKPTDREGVMIYIDRSRDFRSFTKIMFDPVQVYAVPDPEQTTVPADVVARMSNNFHASFRKALAPKYQIVTTAGPDVLRVRTAITGIQTVKPDLKVTDFIPVKAIINLGREAAGAGNRVAEMTAEIEVLDPNGHRVAAATATRKGAKMLHQGEDVTWTQLSAISDYWALGFRQRLDELRGEGRR
jgi:hypothetical protein